MTRTQTRRSSLAAAVVGAMVLAVAAPAASAFQLVPISMGFEPTGVNATQTFGIFNDGQESIAVQVSIVTRSVAVDGTETQAPADEDFTVYPPQAVVAPGKVQLVQVHWLGDPRPAKELAYRILAEQLKIELAPRNTLGGRITILMRYEGAIYVTPPAAQPSVSVESVSRVQTAEGPRLSVTVANKGTAHGALDGPVLSVRGAGASVDLRDEALADLGGVNVLAGGRCQFLLPLPTALATGDLTATLKTGYVQ